MADPDITLIYFDVRGRAEPSRLILAYGDIVYKDMRLTHDQWAAEKPNTPFNQLPVLEVKGVRYGQSVAIAQYLARECGLYGKTNLDALKIDQAVQLAVDLQNIVVRAIFEKDEAKKAELIKNVKEVEAPKFLAYFDKLLDANGTGYFVGNSLTLADIFIYDVCYNFTQRKLLSTENHPLLQALIKKVENQDKIKAYLAKRKPTEN